MEQVSDMVKSKRELQQVVGIRRNCASDALRIGPPGALSLAKTLLLEFSLEYFNENP